MSQPSLSVYAVQKKMEPRYYQRLAVDAIFEYLNEFDGNPLVSMATGTGKAFVIAMICREVLDSWPDAHIINVTTVKELVRQNYEEMIGIWPEAPVSIYSAGLGVKDMTGQLIFAGIQSIYKKAYQSPRKIDAVIIDEVQDVSEEDGTMFRKFIAELKICNPNLRVIGLSATCYRLSQGSLLDGKNAMFDEIVYDYGILQGITDGFLCPLISKGMATKFDLTGVGITKGDYAKGALEKAVDKNPVTIAVVDELVAYGHDRKCWLVFCAGVTHAEHVRDEIRARGITCETVTAKTPPAERDMIFKRYKAGEIRAITNVGVMTKGTNVPQIDLISFLRPTKSAGLFVQMSGRGTRLCKSKQNCLLLDHAGLLLEHGPVDTIQPPRKGEKGEGVAPTKMCPQCKTILFAGFLTCPECGHIFDRNELDIDRRATEAAALSTQMKTETHKVTHVHYFRHQKEGKPDSIRVEYLCGLQSFREWACLSHSGTPRIKACQWWAARSGGKPAPANTEEGLKRQNELATPSEIEVRRVGKYFEIVGVTL